MKWIYSFFFRLAGWKISGDVPRNLNKYIIAVAPHTSNWDFMIGLAVRSIMGFRSNFLGKKELFRFPWGFLFRQLGGYPVDRSKSENKVDQIVAVINNTPYFVIAVAPEGTRKSVNRWKTGFYQIAFKAGIPIVFVSLDYSKKLITFNQPFTPSGSYEADVRLIEPLFKDVLGKGRGVSPLI